MADEAHEKSNEGEAVAEEPKGSFLSRNWPLPVFVVGLAALSAGIWFWQGPSKSQFRDEFLTELAEARELTFRDPYAARRSLGALLDRRWRVPESKGEIYFLMGYANEQLAKAAQDDPETARQYREKALQAESQALQAGVPDNIRLPLHELFGASTVLSQETSKSKLVAANSALADALHRREVIDWILDRRELQILVHDPETAPETINQILKHWGHAETIPNELEDFSEEAAELWKDGHQEEFNKLIGSLEQTPGLGDNVQAMELDDLLRTFIELDLAGDALIRIHEERKENNHRLSQILGFLAQAAMLPSPAHTNDAQSYAERRLAIAGLDQDERAEAQLHYADILLASDKPELAREQLLKVHGSSAQNVRASYLLGKSLLDAGTRIRRADIHELVKSNDSLETWAKWVKEYRAKMAPIEGANSNVVNRLREDLLTVVDPESLKELLARMDYQRAIQTFEKVLAEEDLSDEARAETLLWMGVALSDLGRYDEARHEFQNVIAEIGSGPLEQAARFYLAEVYSRAGLAAESIEALRTATKGVVNPKTFDNKYIRPNQLRDMFVDLWTREQMISRNFTNAIAVAQLFGEFRMSIVEPGQPDKLLALSSSSLAAELNAQIEKVDDPLKKSHLELESRSRFREAGRAYSLVAKAREGTDEYPSLLWAAGTHLFDGCDFESALPIFHKFIVAHVGGPRDFPARIYVTRCYMAEGHFDLAKGVMEDALKQTTTAVDRFRGRILLAECYAEIARNMKGESAEVAKKRQALLELAKGLLLYNLNGQNQELEPSASEWRESLFAYGKLLFEEKKYEEAIEQFNEHVRRYPDDPRSLNAENYIGDAYMAMAEKLDLTLRESKLNVRERARIREERIEKLDRALAQFRRLADKLTTFDDKGKLTNQDSTLLQSSLFNLGRISMLMGDWDAALKTYQDVAYRYQEDPECLTAYIEMSTAYQKLGRPADAQSSLRQALWILDQISPQAFKESDRNREDIRRQMQVLLGTP